MRKNIFGSLIYCLYIFYSSGFLPVAINFLRRVPLLGTILNMPGLSRILDMIAGDSNRTTVWYVKSICIYVWNIYVRLSHVEFHILLLFFSSSFLLGIQSQMQIFVQKCKNNLSLSALTCKKISISLPKRKNHLQCKNLICRVTLQFFICSSYIKEIIWLGYLLWKNRVIFKSTYRERFKEEQKFRIYEILYYFYGFVPLVLYASRREQIRCIHFLRNVFCLVHCLIWSAKLNYHSLEYDGLISSEPIDLHISNKIYDLYVLHICIYLVMSRVRSVVWEAFHKIFCTKKNDKLRFVHLEIPIYYLLIQINGWKRTLLLIG